MVLGRPSKPLREGPTISYARRSEGQEGRHGRTEVGVGQRSETPSAVDWLDCIFLRTVPCDETVADHGRWNPTRANSAPTPSVFFSLPTSHEACRPPRVLVEMTDSLEPKKSHLVIGVPVGTMATLHISSFVLASFLLSRMQNSEPPTPPSTVLILRIAVGSKNPVKINAVQRAIEQVLEASSSSRRKSQQSKQDQQEHQETRVVLQIESFEVPSGVSNQPVGDHETQQGAINRAYAAYEAYHQQVYPPSKRNRRPDLAIGLEGGVEEWSSSYNHNSTTSDHNDSEWTNTATAITHNTTDTPKTTTSTELGCMAWMAIVGKRSNLLAECLASSDSTFYAIDTKPICSVAKTATFLLPTAIRRLIQEQGMELGHADDVLFGRNNSKQDSGTVGILTNGSIDRTQYYHPALVLALVPWIRPDLYYVNTATTSTASNNKTSSPATEQLETTVDMDTENDDEVEDEELGATTSTTSSFWGSLFCVKKKQ